MKYPGPIPFVTFDTNCLNSMGRLEEMNYIDDLHARGIITIAISATMWNELPDGMGAMKRKACGYVLIGEETLINEELQYWQTLRQIIFPTKDILSIRDKRDVQHLFDHRKYATSQWAFFVTNDHHFLDHKSALDTEQILVGTPADCKDWLNSILPRVQERIELWKERTSEQENPEYSGSVRDQNSIH